MRAEIRDVTRAPAASGRWFSRAFDRIGAHRIAAKPQETRATAWFWLSRYAVLVGSEASAQLETQAEACHDG